MRPIIQVSLDVPTIKEALKLARGAVKAGVDWLEAGTPLILGEGLHSIAALKNEFPEKPIVADTKIMDGGGLETEMMAKAGADMVVVMGVAHEATIRSAVEMAKRYKVKIMGDILAASNKVQTARKLEELGVHYIIVHTGYDERRFITGASPLDHLEAVVKAVKIPVQAVGGLNIHDSIKTLRMGARIVVFGAPLIIDKDALKIADAESYENTLREIVEKVKGIEL